MLGKMDCFGITDIGRKRAVNEDQFLIGDLTKSLKVHQTSLDFDRQTRLFGNSQGKLLLVADGMGGQVAGERASTLAVDAIATYTLNTLRWFFRLDEQNDEEFQDDLKEALKSCQIAIDSEVDVVPQRRGMGTTLTMAFLIWPRLYVVHVGDSRCYVMRGGQLRQITRDHTLSQLVREMADASTTAKSDSSDKDPGSNLLWNVIGGINDDLVPEVYRMKLEIGDGVLLCTDGLTRHVSHDRIETLLGKDSSAEHICRQLVDEANAAGGRDNITVVVARFREASVDVDAAEQKVELKDVIEQTDSPVGSHALDHVGSAGSLKKEQL